MTQPHYIDREAVVALIEKLRAVESSCGPSDWSGIRQVTTNWHHNPDGPEAADLIEKLSRPMETVAWREKVARIIDPAAFLFGPDELDAKVYSASRAHAFDRADAILQALAVIPTEGGEGRLVGFATTGTAARTHTEARKGPITRADFGPQGPEGDARFDAYTKGETQ